MGMFHRFGKYFGNRMNHLSAVQYNSQVLIEIAQLISKGDSAVMEEFEEIINKAPEDINKTGQMELVDVLEKHNYVCCRDWRDYFDDFFYFVQNLEGMKIHQLTMSREWFDEDDHIPIWCGILDKKWKSKGMCMAAIDVGSDSYLLFICSVSERKQLKKWSAQIGFKIDLARIS